MPDVFISYSRDDRSVAELIAASLKAEGFEVWWDGVLRAGDSYDEVIEENLRNASSVVVLWSETSVKSKWVRAEATVGERQSTVVPALIQDCDLPIRFELTQTADLREWRGDCSDHNWQRFVADIQAALKTSKAPSCSATQADILSQQTDSSHENVETVFWSTIKDTHVAAELEAYLKHYKDGRFVELARKRLASIALESSTSVAEGVASQAGIPRPLIAISIFTIATMIGIVILVVANAIHIGFFTWTPIGGADLLTTGAKEVGFYYALNWSFATLFLMPAAWTLIYLALSGLRNAWADMASRRMLVTNNFTPVAADHSGFRTLQNHLRLFVVGGIVTVTTLMVVLSMSDHAQVAGQFYGDTGNTAKLDRIDAEGYALETANIERDWMVASFLSTPKPDKVEVSLNNAFSLTTYMIYVGFGIGSLFSFGLVMIGVGAAFMRGVAQNYGLQIIPSLASDDRRCGFEAMQRFFTYAYLVAFIGCVMIYLMGIQNIYLRSPDPNIFAFLAPDLTAFENSSNWRNSIDAAIGFLFSDNVAKGTRNAYAWIFGFFIFAIFIGGFVFFLRQGAAHGRRVVLAEIRSRGVLRLEALTSKDEQTIIAQLNKMRIWPLDQPSLKVSLIIVGLLVTSFIFYKLGVLIVLGLCVALPVHLWRSDRDAILISATADAGSTCAPG